MPRSSSIPRASAVHELDATVDRQQRNVDGSRVWPGRGCWACGGPPDPLEGAAKRVGEGGRGSPDPPRR